VKRREFISLLGGAAMRPRAFAGMSAKLRLSADGTSRKCSTSSERTPVTAQKLAFSSATGAIGASTPIRSIAANMTDEARSMMVNLDTHDPHSPTRVQKCASAKAHGLPAGGAHGEAGCGRSARSGSESRSTHAGTRSGEVLDVTWFRWARHPRIVFLIGVVFVWLSANAALLPDSSVMVLLWLDRTGVLAPVGRAAGAGSYLEAQNWGQATMSWLKDRGPRCCFPWKQGLPLAQIPCLFRTRRP
jgi:hypothetical protein